MQEKRSLDPATTATKVLALSHGAMAVMFYGSQLAGGLHEFVLGTISSFIDKFLLPPN